MRVRLNAVAGKQVGRRFFGGFVYLMGVFFYDDGAFCLFCLGLFSSEDSMMTMREVLMTIIMTIIIMMMMMMMMMTMTMMIMTMMMMTTAMVMVISARLNIFTKVHVITIIDVTEFALVV